MAGSPTSSIRLLRRSMTVEERRRHILDVAAELFVRLGYAVASMGDIASAVGIAKPTLYHYYSSKEEILDSIHDEFANLVIALQERRIGSALAPEQLLLEVMVDIFELVHSHRSYLKVFFENHSALSADSMVRIKQKRARYQGMVEDIVRRGNDSGAFGNAEPRLVALAIFGMCNWAYQWYDPEGPLSPRELAIQFWSYLVRGITSR